MPTRAPRICPRCRKSYRDERCPRCDKAWARQSKEQAGGSTRRWRTLRRAKLSTDPMCEITGCRHIAKEVDHVIPLAQGGERYEWDNLQSICVPHHRQKTARESQQGKHGKPMTTQVTLICGPPCAGKNTYVRQHAKPGDLIVDLDALIQALGAQPSHDHPLAIKPFAFDARDAVLERIWSGRHDLKRAWIILTAPTSKDRHVYRQRGCRVVMVTTDRDTLHERADADRPDDWHEYIDGWLAVHDRIDVDQVILT